ncbi:MAG: hypothetical protein LH679_15550 [Cyanobacteria bacterium CAN_BIN43]|nr:hypothetical protein [Cyanobacteria bacterium CAN_BIN43]
MKLTQMTIGVLAMSLLAVSPGIATPSTNFSDGTGTNFSDGTGTNFSDGTGTNSQSGNRTRFSENADLVNEANNLASELGACQATSCDQLDELGERAQDLLDQLQESEANSSQSNPETRVW